MAAFAFVRFELPRHAAILVAGRADSLRCMEERDLAEGETAGLDPAECERQDAQLTEDFEKLHSINVEKIANQSNAPSPGP
jgi:hypothetical protein